VVQAAVVVIAVFVVAVNVLVDLLYAVLDPRIRLRSRPDRGRPGMGRTARSARLVTGVVLVAAVCRGAARAMGRLTPPGDIAAPRPPGWTPLGMTS
jgi:hypothetical protein